MVLALSPLGGTSRARHYIKDICAYPFFQSFASVRAQALPCAPSTRRLSHSPLLPRHEYRLFHAPQRSPQTMFVRQVVQHQTRARSILLEAMRTCRLVEHAGSRRVALQARDGREGGDEGRFRETSGIQQIDAHSRGCDKHSHGSARRACSHTGRLLHRFRSSGPPSSPTSQHQAEDAAPAQDTIDDAPILASQIPICTAPEHVLACAFILR
ncbi:uncharacterized protein C8Q71DRAFT_738838 [Rhodofomes roseus]|uniref:Uncharacterized protein n=1 Tax=Rhodofomes roseus TaxID=34475 RepID=A0ABQ8KSJ4_9APHY|nr:uncharacterized protein C8Q71DRAFT_738838 [Rhodofomes roseus]KAH9841790.1 hypothetical protein C8Q71DRAFT_738838 [Rhodofomes roseus]